jgi:signal transduction histidine kinase
MEIKDNGKSFQVDRVLNSRGNKRLGLLGMRERVEMIGGTFCVESAPGQGTTLRVEVPFAHVRKNALKKSGKQAPLACP